MTLRLFWRTGLTLCVAGAFFLAVSGCQKTPTAGTPPSSPKASDKTPPDKSVKPPADPG